MQRKGGLPVYILACLPAFAIAQRSAADATTGASAARIPKAPPPQAYVLPPPRLILSTRLKITSPAELRMAPPPPPPPPKWNGDFALGYVKSKGNANASTLNLKFDLDYKTGPWENLLNGTAFKASSDGINTDEKYSIGDKLSYNLGPKNYVFGQVNFDYDHFGAVEQRRSFSTGLGRHLLQLPTQTLDVDVGIGADESRAQDAEKYETDLIGTVDANYLWKITATSQFKQTLRTEFAQNNTFIDPISELKLSIIKNFFATLDYELRYNTKTPVGTYHTDQIESVNLGYTFGKPVTAAP